MITTANGVKVPSVQNTNGARWSEREISSLVRDLLESDPERGVALFDLDGRSVYSNRAANTFLRDGTARGRDALVPESVDNWMAQFVERLRTARGPSSTEVQYPAEGERRLRVTLESVEYAGRPFVVLRAYPAMPWLEPTVRRLQSRFGLTLREAQVAATVARGHTNAEVADKLGIVEKTVKNTLMSVYKKCQVRNRVELALRAYEAPVGNLQPRV